MIHSLHTLVSPLFTPTMYSEIESLSTHLIVSKGTLIRLAVEEYLGKLDDENIVKN